MDNEHEPSADGEELEQARARVAEFEKLVAAKDEESRLANARITELEQAGAESGERLIAVNNALSQAVTSYKALVIKSNPVVPAKLISGDSIETVDKSLENARSLVSQVREGLEAEITATKVPAGAPPRTPADLSALSPREKIQYAIGGKR